MSIAGQHEMPPSYWLHGTARARPISRGCSAAEAVKCERGVLKQIRIANALEVNDGWSRQTVQETKTSTQQRCKKWMKKGTGRRWMNTMRRYVREKRDSMMVLRQVHEEYNNTK